MNIEHYRAALGRLFENGMLQVELERLSGVDQTTINNFLHSRTRNPGADKLLRLLPFISPYLSTTPESVPQPQDAATQPEQPEV